MTIDSNQLDRWRQAYAARSARHRGSDRCPTTEALWDAARGELPADRVRVVVEHTIDCAACAEGWRLAHDVASGLPTGTAGTSTPHRWLRRPAFLAAAAAFLVMAFAVPFLLRGPSAPPAASFRSGEQSTIRSLLDENLPVDRQDCVLRWSAGPPGTAYDVFVATEDLRVLSRASGLESAEYRIDPAELAEIEPRSRLVWRVTARLADGRTIRSRSFLVTLE